MNAANRFIECQRVHGTNSATNSARQTNGTLLLINDRLNGQVQGMAAPYAEQQHWPRQQSPDSLSLSSSSSLPVGGFNVASGKRANEWSLHFGAKVALSILLATVLLVVGATFADLIWRRPGPDCGMSTSEMGQAECCSPKTAVAAADEEAARILHHYYAAKQQLSGQQQQLRDQRSPSLSSCSSSSLVCGSSSSSSSSSSASSFTSSAASVVSASAPILGTCCPWTTSQHQQQPLLQPPRMAATTPPSCSRRSKTGWPTFEQATIEEPVPVPASVTYCHCCSAPQLEAQPQQQASRGSEKAEALSLVKELFLAFSLRHSASTIFKGGEEAASGKRARQEQRHNRAQQYCLHADRRHHHLRGQLRCTGGPILAGHRARLASLSSIDERARVAGSNDEQQVVADGESQSSAVVDVPGLCWRDHHTNHQQHHHHLHHQPQSATVGATSSSASQPASSANESIDSLHGLRFLSMIWIIVVHSYSLATRWSFFANTSSLDNIYKTAASQLLSNGTFACDSFFFAGGFLLAYPIFSSRRPTLPSAASAAGSSNRSIAAAPSRADVSQVEATTKGRTTKEPASPRRIQQGKISDSTRANYDSSSLPDLACNCCHLTTGSETEITTTTTAAGNKTTNTSSLKASKSKQMAPAQRNAHLNTDEFTWIQVFDNLLHRYIRMTPLMMAIIGLSATLLRYLGEGPAWDNSTMMFDKWCRSNWWINALFLHNFLNREQMCLSHSWYSAVDLQLFLLGQLIIYVLFRSKKLGLLLCFTFLLAAPLITASLTLIYNLPAVPLMISGISEQSLNVYYGEIYIKPYCRASPYLIGILLAYLMRTTSLGQVRLKKWQVVVGWSASISTFLAILLAMQPAMNGQPPSQLVSALYSALSRPLWACATGWMIFACIRSHGGPFGSILSASCFVPFSRLTYPAFLIHPIIMALFYGSRQEPANFSHYLMLYLILGHIVITYASAFLLAALFELPLRSAERVIKRAWLKRPQPTRRPRMTHTSLWQTALPSWPLMGSAKEEK